jgi:hypothetical protein
MDLDDDDDVEDALGLIATTAMIYEHGGARSRKERATSVAERKQCSTSQRGRA